MESAAFLPFVPPAWLAAAAFTSMLSFGVLVHGLAKLRQSDDGVVVAWWLGFTLAAGGGFWAALCLLLSSPANVAGLRAGPLLLAWGVSVLSCGAVLGLQRLRPAAQITRGAQAVLLGLAAWLMVQLGTLGLQPASTDGLAWMAGASQAPAPWLGALAQFAVVWLALNLVLDDAKHWKHLGSAVRRQWLAALLVGLTCSAAQAASLADLALTAAQAGTGLAMLGGTALFMISGVSLLTLVIGVSVGEVDRHALLRRRSLTESLDQANRRLREQAMADPLTRLPNRLLFEERLGQALIKADLRQTDLAVLFLDLDGFKAVNDSFGHVAGDTVLREIARRLRQAARPGDMVARIGGDAFLVLAETPGGLEGTAKLARKLLEGINQPCQLPNMVEVKLSCSIGIVLYPEFGPAQKLLACADAAMYAAKRSGGSTYAFFDPSMEIDSREQLELQSDLRRAVENHELELFYQPKIDGLSGMITGVEALVRWHHPTRGLVMPGLFIPIAERFGLIGRLGDWVIDESCRQLREWLDQGLRMRVAINMSAHQLRQDGLTQHIRDALNRNRVEASQLTIEIIESVLMEDAAVRSFSDLAHIGVGLSIDDFGIGYCNFALLRKLPIKQLKVDRSLFTDIHDSADARSVVIAIVKMAHALGLRVVAEGVETEVQRDLLLKLQCDELQGYLFAKPMSAPKLTLWAMGGTDSGHSSDFRPSIYEDEPLQPVPAGSMF